MAPSVLAEKKNPSQFHCVSSSDFAIRTAAFKALDRLVQRQGEILSWQSISAGFEFNGHRVRFANRAVGVFKPAILNDGLP